MPSIFAWSKDESLTPLSKGRTEQAGKGISGKVLNRRNLQKVSGLVSQHVSNTGSCESDEELSSSDIRQDALPLKQEMVEDSTIHLEVTIGDTLQSNEVVSTAQVDDSDNGSRNEGNEIKREQDVDLIMASDLRSKSDEKGQHDREPCSHAMRIADYKIDGKKAELQFYTGFESYEHFMFVLNLLGPAVNNLNYYSKKSLQGGKDVKFLLPEDQFFLTMVKLRRNMLNIELSFRFNVKEETVTCVFITWLNFMYCQLKELNVWPSQERLTNLMNLKGENCYATVVIDCSEIKIAPPKNPLEHQQTYSTSKGCNTMKVLVGISPTGAVTFVSDAYGGSISDRQLFEKSGLLGKLEPNDVVMAKSGFAVQDLVCHKDVKVLKPEFVPAGKEQLKPKQLVQTKNTSSTMINIERIIGLAKTYNILRGTLPTTLLPLAGRILFVCFMLVNFRANIVM